MFRLESCIVVFVKDIASRLFYRFQKIHLWLWWRIVVVTLLGCPEDAGRMIPSMVLNGGTPTPTCPCGSWPDKKTPAGGMTAKQQELATTVPRAQFHGGGSSSIDESNIVVGAERRSEEVV
jgi:hypothetical protein